MTSTIVVCADGSPLALRAATEGIAILRPAERIVVVTVVDADATLMADGSGHAGATLTAPQFEQLRTAEYERAQTTIDTTVRTLGENTAVGQIIEGAVGPRLCGFARDVDARALVLGSRGRGGIKRAFLGSVSDYVVRNAPCPVVVIGSVSVSGDLPLRS